MNIREALNTSPGPNPLKRRGRRPKAPVSPEIPETAPIIVKARFGDMLPLFASDNGGDKKKDEWRDSPEPNKLAWLTLAALIIIIIVVAINKTTG